MTSWSGSESDHLVWKSVKVKVTIWSEVSENDHLVWKSVKVTIWN